MKRTTDAPRASACRTIEDGAYVLRFSAGSLRDTGLLTVAGPALSADNPAFSLRGQVAYDGPSLRASVDVRASREGAPDGSEAVEFRVHLTGTSNDLGFSLIGAGPRGMIVELDCKRHREDLP